MAQWMKVGTDVVVGGGVGALDQVVQNADDKRIEEKGIEEVGLMSRYGTYYNFGIPILSILAVAMGWLRGDWATRAVTAGSQLAGRKATKMLTAKEGAPKWMRNRQLEASHRAQIEAQARARAGAGRTPAGVGLEW